MDGFQQVITKAWATEEQEQNPFRHIFLRLRSTARRLQSWSAKSIGNISLQLMIARELIARLDAAQDWWPLSVEEAWLRHLLKGAYLVLASLE